MLHIVTMCATYSPLSPEYLKHCTGHHVICQAGTMSTPQDNVSKLMTQANKSLEKSAENVVFKPTPEQRRAKSTFWSYFSEDDAPIPEFISDAMASKFGADRRISQWWGSTDFVAWFTNKDEFRQRLEFLSQLALDAAEEILSSPTVPPQAKVNMAKLVIEAANKMPNKYAKDDQNFLDSRIAKMDKKQLEEFISKNIKLLPSIVVESDIE